MVRHFKITLRFLSIHLGSAAPYLYKQDVLKMCLGGFQGPSISSSCIFYFFYFIFFEMSSQGMVQNIGRYQSDMADTESEWGAEPIL